MGWLVLELTGSPRDLGLVLASGGIPSLLFGPWGGAVADRVDLRKLLLATQTLYCLLAACCGRWPRRARPSVAALVAIGVAGGVVQIADSPARQALVSRLVPPATWPARSASTGSWSTAPGWSAPRWPAC